MKIGILGSGDVGKALAAGFHRLGHDVQIGSREPSRLADWARAQGSIATGDFAATARFGEAVVLAVKGTAAAAVLALAGADNLVGKTVIDTTNPIADAPPVDGVLKYFTSLDESLLERLQNACCGAHFVKAFSCVGSALMVDPNLVGGKPTMFICGDDAQAKATVTHLLDQCGWDAADMGGASAARAIEPLAMLWCIPGFLRNDWSHAFKLLTTKR